MYGVKPIIVYFLQACRIFIRRGHTPAILHRLSMRKRSIFYSIFAISFFKRRMIFFSSREM